MSRVCGLMIAGGIALAALGCSGHTPAQQGQAGPQSTASYVNRVWRVQSSSSVEPGMIYVFLSDGTLVITSPHGTPSLGRWEPAGDGLTMIEEEIRYPVTIVTLTASEFRIRIGNPGDPVDIAFTPADVPVPTGPASAERR